MDPGFIKGERIVTRVADESDIVFRVTALRTRHGDGVSTWKGGRQGAAGKCRFRSYPEAVPRQPGRRLRIPSSCKKIRGIICKMHLHHHRGYSLPISLPPLALDVSRVHVPGRVIVLLSRCERRSNSTQLDSRFGNLTASLGP